MSEGHEFNLYEVIDFDDQRVWVAAKSFPAAIEIVEAKLKAEPDHFWEGALIQSCTLIAESAEVLLPSEEEQKS